MKRTSPGVALPALATVLLTPFLFATPASVAVAQATADKPTSAVPPAGRNAQSNQLPPASPGTPSSTVTPGHAYSSGTANVGNSSENKGIPGSQGAGASATMQSGHGSNQ